MQDRTKVIILGGGPGSIFAYYGALAADYDHDEIQIWANGLTYPPGAFWVHQLPQNCEVAFEPTRINVHLAGIAEEYSRKQWGVSYPTSAATYCGKSYNAYNPHVVLPTLWEICNTKKVDVKWDIHSVLDLAEQYEFVIVTFPITHEALSVFGQLKVPIYHSPINYEKDKPDNYCLYNGMEGIDWVRVTKIFGHISVEYPHLMAEQVEYILEQERMVWGDRAVGKVSLVPEMHPLTQPIKEKVIGRSRNVLLTGRWATLNRKALSHDSWNEVYDFITGEGELPYD